MCFRYIFICRICGAVRTLHFNVFLLIFLSFFFFFFFIKNELFWIENNFLFNMVSTSNCIHHGHRHCEIELDGLRIMLVVLFLCRITGKSKVCVRNMGVSFPCFTQLCSERYEIRFTKFCFFASCYELCNWQSNFSFSIVEFTILFGGSVSYKESMRNFVPLIKANIWPPMGFWTSWSFSQFFV